MDAVESDNGLSHWDALSLYLEPIIQISRSDDSVCLCGVLGGEYVALPKEMQVEIAAFFEEHQKWLAKLLDQGRKAGEFRFSGSPDGVAKLAFSAVEGALLIKRATKDPRQFEEVMSLLQAMLRN